MFLEYAVSLAAGDGKRRVCFIPTVTGDSPSAVEAVTEVFAGREDVAFSVLTLFRQPSVPDAVAHLRAQDVLLVGGGSVVNLMAAWRAHGLGLLPYSNGVHDSLGDQPRRRVYREYVANGELLAGYATEDGVGLHYIGTELREAVAMRDGARAWWVPFWLVGEYGPMTERLAGRPHSSQSALSRSPFPPIAEYGCVSDCEVPVLVAASASLSSSLDPAAG